MRNLKLTLAYDGTDYVGWQMQTNGRAIQEVLEKAISRLTGEPSKLLVAGRTDSGVHALGQVCSLRTNAPIPCRGFRAALQDLLPEDILVREVEEVPLDFHATYSAKSKHYRYVIWNSQLPNPFVKRYAYHYPVALEVDAMHAAAQELLGTHDFRCFESRWPNKATSVRTVKRCSVSRQTGWPIFGYPEPSHSQPYLSPKMTTQPVVADGHEYLWMDIEADGFLYNMVRAITGTLIRVGRGYWQPSDIRRIIDEQDRTLAGETAPAHGLYLVSVNYGGADRGKVDESLRDSNVPVTE